MLEHPHSKCLTNGSQVLLGVLSPDFPILGTRGCEPPRPVWGRAGPQQRSHQPLMTQAFRNPHAEALLPTESLPRRAQLCVSWEPRRAGRLSSSVVSWTAASKPELSSPGTQLRLRQLSLSTLGCLVEVGRLSLGTSSPPQLSTV